MAIKWSPAATLSGSAVSIPIPSNHPRRRRPAAPHLCVDPISPLSDTGRRLTTKKSPAEVADKCQLLPFPSQNKRRLLCIEAVGGHAIPINRFLSERLLEPDQVERLNKAYAFALRSLARSC